MDSIKKAHQYFSTGCNCSQAVFAALSEKVRFNEAKALQIAAGFGAGICYQGQTCGAVTGAYMALGLHSGTKQTSPDKVKEQTYQLIKNFNQSFIETYGSTNCTELLNKDLSDGKQLMEARESGLFVDKCPKIIAAAIQIAITQIEQN